MTATTQPVLRVQGLRTRIGAGDDAFLVVDDVSLELGAGQVLALLGESGSGKTMTALSIMGLLPGAAQVVAGEIRHREHDLLSLTPQAMRALRGSRMAMVFQNPRDRLDPVYTVGDQLVEVLLLHGVCASRAAARTRAVELFDEVRIVRPERVADLYAHQLSGGMLQRITIAMALATSPDVLIADEPTSALDVTIQAEILDLLAELQARHDMSMLFITHDIGVARQIADTVTVMYAGQVVETGPAEELLREPRHPYTRALLECVPDGRPTLRPIPGRAANLRALPPGCRFAPRCQQADRHGKQDTPPPLVALDSGQVRCWLYGDEA